MGAQLDARAKPSGADTSDPSAWVEEGFELAKSRVYQPPISDDEPDSPVGIPDKQYHHAAKALAESQVLLAGYRLAGVLNQTLGSH